MLRCMVWSIFPIFIALSATRGIAHYNLREGVCILNILNYSMLFHILHKVLLLVRCLNVLDFEASRQSHRVSIGITASAENGNAQAAQFLLCWLTHALTFPSALINHALYKICSKLRLLISVCRAGVLRCLLLNLNLLRFHLNLNVSYRSRAIDDQIWRGTWRMSDFILTDDLNTSVFLSINAVPNASHHWRRFIDFSIVEHLLLLR
jgi:hypothetical protein